VLIFSPRMVLQRDRLTKELGLAPITIRQAVHQLRDEGLVRTTPGWGTYVVKKNDDANP
jgi:DNA-binding GntR family transcriptional regulator